MIKKTISFVLLGLMVSACGSSPAAARVRFEGQIAGRFQTVEAEERHHFLTGWEDVDQQPGFSEGMLNLRIHGEVTEGINGYTELLAGGAGDNFEVYEAYLSDLRLIPAVDFKFGRFELPFGTQHRRRSHNANVQSNPLIGNAVFDPAVVQTGLELSGRQRLFDWELALTSGDEDGGFNEDRGLAITGRIEWEVLQGLKLAASYYSVNHQLALRTNFGRNSFSREAYEAGAPLIGPDLRAQQVDAYQFDINYRLAGLGHPAELYFNYGKLDMERVLVRGQQIPLPPSDEFRVEYLTAEARYNILPIGWLALRWSRVDLDGTGDVERLQGGAGYSLSPRTRLKIEYVSQEIDEEIRSYVAEFDGVITELSIIL